MDELFLKPTRLRQLARLRAESEELQGL